MHIVIVRKFTKNGIRFFAYKYGILSRLKIFCFWNLILLTGDPTKEGCISLAREELRPGPDPDPIIISIVEIKPEGGEKTMRTNVKIAILEIIRDETALCNPDYFWTGPGNIADLLAKRYSMPFIRETVARYLKALIIDGYLTSPLVTRNTDRKAPAPVNQNLELTKKAVEYLALTKAEQKVHF